MRKCILLLPMLTGIAHGTVNYQFDYIRSSGPIQSFSIVITASTYLGGTGAETPLTAVSITDGTTNWSVTKYKTENLIGPECYLFGTGSVSLNGCSSNSVLSGDGSFFVGFLGNPTSLGVFIPDFWGGSFLGGTGGSISSSTGTMSLTITDPSAITCAGVPNNPLIRAEDYTVRTGDIFITCVGGIPTALGSQVPKVDITVFAPSTTITSKITDASVSPAFNEALLIVDEAGSAGTLNPILNCGNASAPFGSTPYTCDITGTGTGAGIYNGSSGRPNVFQARQVSTSGGNAIQFLGVPLDPPGSNGIVANGRTLRITNLRVNAAALPPPSGFPLPVINTFVTFSGQVVGGTQVFTLLNGTLRSGLVVSNSTNAGPADFLQCTATAGNAKYDIALREDFPAAFRARNWRQIQDNGIAGCCGWGYNGTTIWSQVDVNQNVPNALYNTESGLMFPPGLSDPSPNNPPVGISAAGSAPIGVPFSDMAGVGGVDKAGTVTQGTRFAVRFSAIPAGSNPSIPNLVALTSGGTTTGVMALVFGADANGAGGLPTQAAGSTLISTLASNIAIYEVLFSTESAVETATITVTVAPAGTPQIAALNATASFAPFYAAGTGAGLATQMASTFSLITGSFPLPRFRDTVQGPFAVYDYSNCGPAVPTLQSPADGSTGISLAQSLNWSVSSNATSYDVHFGTTNPPPLVASTSGTSYSPGPLAFNTTYYWNIVATNGSVTASSAVYPFHTVVGGAQPISLVPSSGSAGRQLFSFVARDPLGASSVQYAQLLFSKSGISALNACYISYDPGANVFYLLSDDMTQWYGLLGGSGNTIGNAQCTIYGATSGSAKSGTDLTTNVDISFRSGFSGLKSIYQFDGDTLSVGSGWQMMGTWNDTGDPSVVELISLTPNSGTGVSQTFTAVTKDGDGAATIPFVQMVMNAGLSGFNGCFIHYDRASNVFFLLNDTGTAWSGLVAGSAAQVSNSQCTLHGVGSGGVVAGSNLTITYNLDLAAGFAGAKQIFMQAVDNTGIIEVWRQMGTWTR